MKRAGLILAFLVMLTGCETLVEFFPVEGMPSAKLEAGHKAHVALAADGKYAGKAYADSGRQVSGFVAKELTQYTSSVHVENQILPLENLLKKASESRAKYLFVPKITHWEPRAAAWSGIPTRVYIELEVYDVASGNPVAANAVSARGRIATLKSQHAHDVADAVVKDLVKSFY